MTIGGCCKDLLQQNVSYGSKGGQHDTILVSGENKKTDLETAVVQERYKCG